MGSEVTVNILWPDEMDYESKMAKLLGAIDAYQVAKIKQMQLRFKGSPLSETLHEQEMQAERDVSFIIDNGEISNN